MANPDLVAPREEHCDDSQAREVDATMATMVSQPHQKQFVFRAQQLSVIDLAPNASQRDTTVNSSGTTP
jgi:hypothetical protein